MAAGFITKTVGDGNSGTFSARFFSSDGTTGGLLYPAPVLTDPAGAQAIGTVGAPEAGTMLKLLTDTLSAMQSIRDATNTINVAQDASKMFQGATSLTPVSVAISASSSGNNTLVAAAGAGNKIRVLAYNLMGNGAVNAKFQSGASGTDLTGLKYIAAAGGGIVAPFNPVGWFTTAANTLLNLNLSGAVAVGGELVYVVVT